MQLRSYVVVEDHGFAPNPFHGYCTLAACTPNHIGLKMNKGDWLIGHATMEAGHGLIYAMEISETMNLDKYYLDPRFIEKRPRFDRTWREACGDNIYYQAKDNSWLQAPTRHHDTEKLRKQDLRYARVYISEHFYYFGEKASPLPQQFTPLLRLRCGCSGAQPTKLAISFLEWLQTHHKAGIIGEPRDRQVNMPSATSLQLIQLKNAPSKV